MMTITITPFIHPVIQPSAIQQLRELRYEEEKANVSQHLSPETASGLCLTDARDQIEKLKRKSEEAALQDEELDDDENDKQRDGKRRRKGANGKDASAAGDDNDIDTEDEAMYAQAVLDQDPEDEHMSGEETQAMAAAPAAHSMPMQLPAGTSKQKRAHPPAQAVAKAVPTMGAASGSGGNGQQNGHGPGPANGSRPHPQSPRHPLPDGAAAAIAHKTWGNCINILSLKLGDATGGTLFQVPDALKSDQQKAKWAAESVKQKPWVSVLEKALSADSTVKILTQSFNSAITQAKKVNSKVDKKLDYETESDGQKTFSVRVAKLRSALEGVKELKGMVFANMKHATMEPKALENAIGKVQTPFQELNGNKWMGFPEHWVQASEGSV